MKTFELGNTSKVIAEKFQQPLMQVNRAIKPIQRLTDLGSRVLGWLPASIQSTALTPMLNHALNELTAQGEFDFLENRCCRIRVRDRNLAWYLSFKDNRLLVKPEGVANVTISATVPAYLALVSQTADPDTLFFQRQLSIEGDVEMGLQIKNMLDALDEDDLPLVWRKTLNAIKRLIQLEASD